MPALFDRAYRVNVGGTEIDARQGVRAGSLRIAFAVERSVRRTPNAVELRVWNLNPAHRAALAKAESVTVQLEAGYVGSVGTLFLGDLRTARSVREGADIVTTVSGGDGEFALRTARISRTFAAGSTVAEVLRELGRSLGLGAGNLEDAAARLLTQRLGRAQTLSGLTYDQLEAFCRSRGLRWSIQDSQIQIREGDTPIGGQGPLLRADSGLVGTPEVETTRERGTLVSGTCLLQPDIVPGRAIRVESDAYTGNLIVQQTTARGDSHGQEWYLEWVGKPYSA